MKTFFLSIILLISFSAYADKSYVKGVQRVTFRSGPTTDSKILKMMDADSPVTVLEAGEEWVKVKDSQGLEGYILGQFLSTDVPSSLLYKWIKSKFEKLEIKHLELKEKKKEAILALKLKEDELNKSTSDLKSTQSSYKNLKASSEDFLKLQSNHKKINALLDDQNSKVLALESQLSRHYIYWFLAGGGVLLLGWFLGLQSKKNRHSSSLIF
ncbi:MAG: TIGR04211 family SH3 domain-containing protein [Bacteriovoracaceae bacterium]|jgi:SH3 domain protein|nr:TIGR04211 family SH3 domain-containing protein [Bacteriovoracaceae bacterium]